MSETPAIKFLKDRKVDFEIFEYSYEEKGGTRQAADSLGVNPHIMLKTIVFRSENTDPFIVIMFGDKEVPEKFFAKYLNAKKIYPCDAKTATEWTGYQFGGTSPFGTRHLMKVFIHSEIFNLNEIYINGVAEA